MKAKKTKELTKEQKQELKQQLYGETIKSLSFAEAVTLVNSTVQKHAEARVENMSEEERYNFYTEIQKLKSQNDVR